ncbi:MAG: hypothetical protein HKN37_01000 [Rhodothermales bacterium]|nr:hypothetical protein [Rhodothermales bacterium]
MSTNSESNYTEVRAVPSVSRDRWLEHARKKLEKGYALIVSEKRKNANFYLAGRGYETCQHKTALLLIKQGVVKKAGKHHLGVVYLLSDDAKIVLPPAPVIVDDDDDETTADSESDAGYEDMLDELDDEVEDDDEEDDEEEDKTSRTSSEDE